MWGALYDERTGPTSTTVFLSSSVIFTAVKIDSRWWHLTESLVEIPVPCRHTLFTVLHVTLAQLM
jgi:hypothetical protein